MEFCLVKSVRTCCSFSSIDTVSLTSILDIYYVAFPNDKRLAKYLVYGIYLIETIQTILISHEAFDEYARGFGNLDALNAQGLKPIAVPIFTGIGTFIVCSRDPEFIFLQ